MSSFKTIGIMIKGALEVYRIVPDFIVSQSAWIEVTPFPDDQYVMEVKDESSNREFLSRAIKACPDNVRWWSDSPKSGA